MRFRKLRIAWSIAWGIACLLLIALWVRSYWHWDEVGGPFPVVKGLMLNSRRGQLHTYLYYPSPISPIPHWYHKDRDPNEDWNTAEWMRITAGSKTGFSYQRFQESRSLSTPDWLPVLLTATLAVLPWLVSRFRARAIRVVSSPK